MAIVVREGNLGLYYTSERNTSAPLNESQRKVNATYIYKFFKDKGWTVNAIASMLGNLQHESSLNPGRWQSDIIGSGGGGGYGLVQWTPYTNYTNWVDNNNLGNWESLDNNLARIEYEFENGLQYYATDSYPESFYEFSRSTKDLSYLTTAFLRNYERAGVEALDTRINYSNAWYTYLTSGEEPPQVIEPVDPGTGGTTTLRKKKKYKFLLFNKRRDRK